MAANKSKKRGARRRSPRAARKPARKPSPAGRPLIGFVGAGNMARSLAAGLLKNGWPRTRLLMSDPDSGQRRALEQTLRVRTDTDNNAVAARADILILAVKPQILRDVTQTLVGAVQRKRPLIISIAAGVRLGDVERWLGGALAVVRAMPNTAALIGSGSEVLGFDTPQSTDHHWGPRVMLFLGERDHAEVADEVTRTLSERLPHTFMGYPTNFGPPDDGGVRLLLPIDRRPVDHRADVESVPQFFSAYLGWDGSADPTPEQWLTFSEHKLRSVTGGAVFHDPEGVLSRIREQLAWYPDDVWRYVMAAEWNHIDDEEAEKRLRTVSKTFRASIRDDLAHVASDRARPVSATSARTRADASSSLPTAGSASR